MLFRSINIDFRDITEDKKDYSWVGGIELGVAGFKNQYNLPLSEMIVNRANGVFTVNIAC